MAKTRVAQWATGVTGKLALRAVIDDPDLDLVGVRVYDTEKVEKDAGALVDRPDTGILTTDRREDIVECKPDIVLYMGNVERHGEACVDDVVELLTAGIDVVSTGSSFIDTYAFNPGWADRLEQACMKGKATFLGLGVYPGFYGEAIAPVLSRLSYTCDTIIVREALDYSGYDSPVMLFDVMGYGKPADHQSPLGGDRPSPFAGTATVLAKALGLEVKAVTAFREVALTSREIQVLAGTVPAGTVGAIKFGARADCGDVSISVEHVTWMAPDVKPEWSERQGYEIEFDGAPSMRLQLLLGIKGEDHTDMGCLATAMHAVHAIPVVLAASEGVKDLADLPPFTGRIVAGG
jgi:hypothetical protein